jgi:hypothetical protein
MLKCSKCKEKLPDDLVQPMFVINTYINVCGVCALEIVRETHNIPSYQFSRGSIARETYERTKAYKGKRNVH